jgi:hypothetical protein
LTSIISASGRRRGGSGRDELPAGGVLVSNGNELVSDVEAILLEDLGRTGALQYYRG